MRTQQKVMREITQAPEPVKGGRVLRVTFKDGGKCAYIRRDLIEFYPGRAAIPQWLDKKIFQ